MTTEIDRIANLIRTQDILRRHNFFIKKKYGQNFLTDGNILSKIVEAAEIDKNTNVIEIGPGIGSLTQYLLEAAAEVMAFEIDNSLIPILGETLEVYDNLQIVNVDVLKVDLNDYTCKFANSDLQLKVVANLPYYITTPILMHLIESKIPFETFVVMMQKEVAERIAAVPGTKAYGALSIAVQLYMETELAFDVSRNVFVPAPNVDSAVLKMMRRKRPLIAVKNEDFFFKIVKMAFAYRRKTLMNNLLTGFGKDKKAQIENLLVEAQISPTMRAETLSIADFGRLADTLLQFK